MADGIRVLSVDDEPALLEVGKLFLERYGEFLVDTVISAPQALNILNKKNYDAIVSDYQMPEMDGIELLKRVRLTDKTIPFIIFTGRGREEVVIEALNNGADFYLQKGGDPKTLYTELSHVIRQSVQMKRTLMTLAEQEQRYHDLQNANDLIQSVAPDGHFLFVNKKWLDTLGYQEHEIPPLIIFDVIHEDSLKHCMETFQRVISGETVGIIDAVFRTRNGMKVYVEGMASCRIVEGQPQYTRGIFTDVTDRKKADAALKESEERYRNVVEDQTEFISRFRPDGTYVFVNDAYCRYFNKTREEIIGKRHIPKITEEDRAGVTRHLASLTREHPVATESNRVIMEDGRIRWQQRSNRAIFDDDGHVLEYQSVGRDITDLKEAEYELLRKNEEINAAFEEITATEEELRQNYDQLSEKEQELRASEEQYRALYNDNPIMLFTLDSEVKVISVNHAGASQLGYTACELEGQSVLKVFYADDHRAVTEHLQICLKSPGEGFHWQFRKVRKDGSLIWVDEHARAIVNSAGDLIVLVVCQDVTERRKTEDALRQANKKLNILSSISRHDVNNQLLALNGFVKLLHRKIPDPAFEDYFNRITKASSRINDMIQFTKEYEKIGIRVPAWQDIHAIVDRAGKVAVLGQVTLKNDLPADTEVLADPLIVKVFFNMIDNAVRHGGRITTIRFSVEVRNGDRIIVCEDDGDGVVNDEKEMIFDRGFGKNTGFGLTISREILDITGITINETGKPGLGARFEIIVPEGQYRSAPH
ncbi:MAG: PAS domain S-box protein [Methanoregula sp.]|nr:PAS domain S-box protein [Methanoregula sp.]